jgi:hypothetical protein
MNPESCCDSKQIYLKVAGEQEVAAKWVSAQKYSASAITIVPGALDMPNISRPANNFTTGPPSYHSPVPLFIQNCFFRI